MIRDVLVLGGSGFIGRHLVAALAARGVRVTVPTRRRERAKHLILLPTVSVVEADIHDRATLRRLVAGRGAVINLIGVLHGRRGTPEERAAGGYGPDFARAHADLPRAAIAACREQRVPRILHMSALGAARDAPSEYLRSKAVGEEAVLDAVDLAGSVFRPSVVFGPEDRFLNLFARLAALMPVLALAGAEARFQPVYVGDVVRAFIAALDERASYGKRYDLCGPDVRTLRDLVQYVCRLTGRRRLVIGLPGALATLMAWKLEHLPGPLLSRDNLLSMQVPSTCDCELPFGITATPLEAIAPHYLLPGGPRSRYTGFRDHAGR